jgi:hypothetical protein
MQASPSSKYRNRHSRALKKQFFSVKNGQSILYQSQLKKICVQISPSLSEMHVLLQFSKRDGCFGRFSKHAAGEIKGY